MPTNVEWLERFRAVMPFGSSTCSKAAHYLPEEPTVIVRGEGCRVWDADGKEYIDYRNSLGPVTLGYRFPAVDDAIRAQLDQGIIFGHPHPVECEAAELLCEVIPCAEQARFLKTGGESCAACLKLARAYTGRERVIQVGYNGWINSVAAGARVLPRDVTRDAPTGVPQALSAIHHACNWNDIAGVEAVFDAYPGEVAAVMVSAAYAEMPAGKEFYPALRKLTEARGALLICDEIVTGFRIALGGAHEYFGFMPDLAVFAKGMANGMPLSVYCGRKEVMQTAEKAIISSTYGGEALSLAAAKAAIEVYRDQDVVGHIWRQGETLWPALNALFAERSIPMAMEGLWACPQMVTTPDAPADLLEKLFRAAYRNGVSLYNCGYVNFSHKDADIADTLARLTPACDDVAASL